jgi:hypothetical protein
MVLAPGLFLLAVGSEFLSWTKEASMLSNRIQLKGL